MGWNLILSFEKWLGPESLSVKKWGKFESRVEEWGGHASRVLKIGGNVGVSSAEER